MSSSEWAPMISEEQLARSAPGRNVNRKELKFDLGHRSDIARIALLVNTPGEECAGWL